MKDRYTREEVTALPGSYRVAVPKDGDVFIQRDVLERLRVTALSAIQEAETWKELANHAETALRQLDSLSPEHAELLEDEAANCEQRTYLALPSETARRERQTRDAALYRRVAFVLRDRQAVAPAFGVVDGEPYCLECGGKPGDHSDECTQGDLAIKVPTKRPEDRCVCGHDKDEHHPCGSCENRCGCLNYRAAAG